MNKPGLTSNRLDGYSEARLLKRAKWSDGLFAILGLLVLVATLVVLGALIADFVSDGAGRIDGDFLTSYPSRRPGSAGSLSA